MCVIDTIDDSIDDVVVPNKHRLGVEMLVAVIMNFDSDCIEKYDEIVGALFGRYSYTYALKNLDPGLKNKTVPPT